MKRSEFTCLADFLDIPHIQPIEFKHLKAVDLSTQAIAGMNETLSHADSAAINFYTLGHLVNLIRAKRTPHETLPEIEKSILRMWRENMIQECSRMVNYLTLIIAREVRHVWEGGHGVSKTSDMYKEIIKEVGADMYSFQAKIRGSSPQQVFTTLHHIPASISALHFVKSVTWMFAHGHCNGGYGGPPWAKISELLARMLESQISPEIMVDGAFALAHNNGPIFNKGMYYEGYSSEFINLLDVQRAGLLPELVIEGKWFPDSVSAALRQVVTGYAEQNPGVFESYLDWRVVEARGALGNCYGYIKQMDPKHMPKAKPQMIAPGKLSAGSYQIDQMTAVPTYTRVA